MARATEAVVSLCVRVVKRSESAVVMGRSGVASVRVVSRQVGGSVESARGKSER